MFTYFLLELCSFSSTLVFIYFTKKTVDIALSVVQGDLQTYLSFVIITAVLGLALRSLSQWINQNNQIEMLANMQYRVVEKQMSSVWRVVKKWDSGDLLVRLNSDCSEVIQMLSSTWISFILTVIKILASFIFLYSMDNVLAWIILCVTPLFLLSKLYFKKLRQMNKQVKSAESALGSAMQENLRYRIVLRALGVLVNRLGFLKQRQEDFVGLKTNYLKFNIASGTVMRSAMTLGYLIAFSWGVYRLESRAISFGTMTAFLQLVNQIQAPLLTLGAFFPAFVRFKVSLDRIEEVYKVEQEELRAPIEVNTIDRLVCDQICFKYDRETIIQDFSAVFNKGEITAVMGSSGKGKTTLIRLLLGLIQPNEGNIFIHSAGHKEILNSAYLNHIAYVPQGNTLLMGTIRENILLDQQNVSAERLNEVLYLSCAEFVYDLPDGLDTYIGESGLGLSEGQAQRIAIARILLRDAKIWLFDEATSALDQHTTTLFLDRIKNLIRDKIVIFVTHDLRVAQACNHQLLMN